MKLSTKCRYGARAVVEIALNYENGPVKRKTISLNQDISDSYLENILLSLKSSGIISTTRGPNGGYVLRRPPSEITFLEVVKALEGDISTVDCIGNPGYCKRNELCSTREVWKKMEEAQVNILKSITVQDIVKKEKILRKD